MERRGGDENSAMNRGRIDAQLAEATYLFRRGDLEQAEALFAELADEYERHHFVEGSLALAFNRLCVALERGERAQVLNLLEELRTGLFGVPQTPWICELCESLIRLFREPIPGIDDDIIAGVANAARERLAFDDEPWSFPVDFDTLPDLDAFAGLHPEELAFVLAAIASQKSGPIYAHALARRLGMQHKPTLALQRAVEEAQVLSIEPRYQQLVTAFETAINQNPLYALELELMLSTLEAKGLPPRVDYLLDFPVERRLRAAIRLHFQCANALQGLPEFEQLAEQQWRFVKSLAAKLKEKIDTRTARQSVRAEDVAWRAEIACAVVPACLALCEGLEAASAVLEDSLHRAIGRMLDDHCLAAKVLLLGGILAEQQGATNEAERHFSAAYAAALPSLQGVTDFHARAERLEALLVDAEPGVFSVGLEALCGMARLSKSSGPLFLADEILCFCRAQLGHFEIGRLRLHIELTSALLNIESAASRALGVASALEHGEGLVLSQLFLIKAATTDEARREAAMALLPLLETAPLGRVRMAGAVQVVRTLEETGSVEIERAVAQLVLAAAPGWSRNTPFDMYLDSGDPLAELVAHWIETGEDLRLRRLAAELRAVPLPSRVPTLSERVILSSDVAQRALEGRGDSSDLLVLWREVLPRVHSWPLKAPARDEVRLEYTSLSDFVLLQVQSAARLRSFSIPLDAGAQAQGVQAYREALLSGADTRPFLERLSALYIEPALVEIEQARPGRLTFVVSGILADMPWSSLWGKHVEAQYTDLPYSDLPPYQLIDRFDQAVALEAPLQLPSPMIYAHRPRAAILGEGVDCRLLDLSLLEGDGIYEEIRFAHDFEPDALAGLCEGRRLVALVGPILEVDGAPAILLRDNAQPILIEKIAEAMAAGGVLCAYLAGPVEGALGQRAIRELLRGVRGAVLVRRYGVSDDSDFLFRFFSGIAPVEDIPSLYEVFGGAVRGAFQSGSRGASAFSLCVVSGE